MSQKRKKEKVNSIEDQLLDNDIIPETDPQATSDSEDNFSHKGPADERLAEMNDKYLRLYSEFDNYRKRTSREMIELGKTASAGVITSLLPVLDDFERALRSMTSTEGIPETFQEGVILIYNKFLNILIQKGLEQMKTIGEPFDTDYHEAITSIPAPTPDLKGRVVDEVEKGYMLHGKVIRYAKVVVGN